MIFISRATLIIYCVCMFGASVAGACHWGRCNRAQMSAESVPITTTIGMSCADYNASGGVRVCGAGGSPARLKPGRVHHNEYGRIRLRHLSSPFDAMAEDSDDDDDDDDTDLLVPPFVRRHRTVDPRQPSMESMLTGGQSAVLAVAQASARPCHEIRPATISLESLHIRLQI